MSPATQKIVKWLQLFMLPMLVVACAGKQQSEAIDLSKESDQLLP
jgi:hypothetical protein